MRELQAGRPQMLGELATKLNADVLVQVTAHPSVQTDAGLGVRLVAEALNTHGGQAIAFAAVDVPPPLTRGPAERVRPLRRPQADGRHEHVVGGNGRAAAGGAAPGPGPTPVPPPPVSSPAPPPVAVPVAPPPPVARPTPAPRSRVPMVPATPPAPAAATANPLDLPPPPVSGPDQEPRHDACPSLALLPLLAAVGCGGGPDRPPSDGPASPEAERLAPMQVVFTSTDLARSTAVGTVSRTIDGVGIMHLTVPVRALTDEDLTVDYRFTYLDENRAVRRRSRPPGRRARCTPARSSP